jgi:hypothetical protein
MTASDGADAWGTFFAAALGATATLIGLLFVAVSINLDRLVAAPRLLARAGETLVGLVLTLVVAALIVIPQPETALAVELLLTCGAVAGVTLRVQLAHGPDRRDDPWWWFAVRVATVAAMALPGLAAGATILLTGGHAAPWAAGGVVAEFVVAAYSAWVLLVEIVRQAPSPS